METWASVAWVETWASVAWVATWASVAWLEIWPFVAWVETFPSFSLQAFAVDTDTARHIEDTDTVRHILVNTGLPCIPDGSGGRAPDTLEDTHTQSREGITRAVPGYLHPYGEPRRAGLQQDLCGTACYHVHGRSEHLGPY